jgi:hypothetical protein
MYYAARTATKRGADASFVIISVSALIPCRVRSPRLLKRAFIGSVTLAALLVLASCGGGNSGSSSSQTTTSGIKLRAYVTNEFKGNIEIINAATDKENQVASVDANGNTVLSPANVISAGVDPTIMALSPDKSLTLVFDTGSNYLSVITNADETNAGQILLPSGAGSLAVGADNKTGYASMRNAAVAGLPSGAIAVLDLTAYSITATIPVPAVTRIVMSHNGAKLLAFSDGSDQMSVIDTATKAVTTVSGFDRPVYGVFSSDDGTAYILSCGPECGGVQARVNTLTLSNNSVGTSVPVSAATVGLLDSSNLYVAGTSGGAGKLDILSASSMTVSKSGVAITDGYHWLMALGANGKLFVGARTCSNVVNGCLSIVNTSAGTATLSARNGDVTGLQPITGRNVVYVIEGGELVIYDTTTDKPQSTQIDIVGKAYDVKLVD